jgi:hypothetical protein
MRTFIVSIAWALDTDLFKSDFDNFFMLLMITLGIIAGTVISVAQDIKELTK